MSKDLFKVTDYLREMVDENYKGKPNSKLRADLHKRLLKIHKKNDDFGVGVSGYYYIHQQTGPWFEDALKVKGDKELNFPLIGSDFKKEYFADNWGALIKNINIPEIFFDYDNISSRAKTIVNATKQSYNGDVSVTYLEDNKHSIITYHDLWLKYMKHVKKGSFKAPKDQISMFHYDVNYQNAIFVIMFDPMMNIRFVSKILGVMPINLPLKEYLGNRDKPEVINTTFNYKSVDMYYDIIQAQDKLEESEIFQDFKSVILRKG